ncbi:MAG: hypothetical protein ACRETN_06965, partial [Nevskiales bacterium]
DRGIAPVEQCPGERAVHGWTAPGFRAEQESAARNKPSGGLSFRPFSLAAQRKWVPPSEGGTEALTNSKQ